MTQKQGRITLRWRRNGDQRSDGNDDGEKANRWRKFKTLIVHSITRWVRARVAMMPNPVEVSGR